MKFTQPAYNLPLVKGAASFTMLVFLFLPLRVMAAVAAQAKAEKEAKEAAKKTAKENDELQQANRAKRQERAKAVADAKAANEARAAENAQREEREAAAAAAAGPAMRGGGVGGGGALLADMSLEVWLKKAIDSGVSEAVGWPSVTLVSHVNSRALACVVLFGQGVAVTFGVYFIGVGVGCDGRGIRVLLQACRARNVTVGGSRSSQFFGREL